MNISLLTGLICGAMSLGGAVLIQIAPKYKWVLATLILAVLTPVALAGFWFSPGTLGISDWDYYFSLHTNWRETILQYHQFPLWNPYVCGGSAALADPEFSVLTPSYLLELIFGVPTGLRLAIYLMTFLGATGLLALAKRLSLSPTSGLFVGIIYAFGSVNLLEIVEGHPNIFAAGWIPWIFWAYLGAYRAWPKLLSRHVIWLSLFLAVTFYQGGIYLLMYTALAFLGLPLLTKKPLGAYAVAGVAGLIALGLSAVKLIPVFFWLQEFQDQAYASSTLTLPWLYKILAGRYLHGAEVIPNQGGGWHEYGAYVGVPVLILALVGAILYFKQRIVKALILTTIVALLVSSLGPVLKPLFDNLDFLPRSNISRFILFAILPLSLLAGYGLQSVGKYRPRLQLWVAPLLVGLVALDLTSLAISLSNQAFILPPVLPAVAPAPSPIAFTTRDFRVNVPKNEMEFEEYTRAYAATLAGFGTMSYCSVLTPEPAVLLVTDPGGDQVVSISDPQGSVQLLSWTPNRVRLRATATTSAQVMINTNYARGWQVNGQAAREMGNRVGTIVPARTIELDFRYQPPGLTVGLLLTMLTIFTIGFYALYTRFFTK